MAAEVDFYCYVVLAVAVYCLRLLSKLYVGIRGVSEVWPRVQPVVQLSDASLLQFLAVSLPEVATKAGTAFTCTGFCIPY